MTQTLSHTRGRIAPRFFIHWFVTILLFSGTLSESHASLLFLINQGQATENTHAIYSKLDSDSYSETMSIDALFDDFRGPLEPGTIALTYNRAEVGVKYESVRVARFFRYDYALTFSEDLARLNFQVERSGSDSIDRTQAYDVFAKADHIRSDGFLIGKTFDLSDRFKSRAHQRVILDIEFSWMQSEQYYDGTIRSAINPGSYTDNALAQFEAELDTLANQSYESFSEAVTAGQAAQVQARILRELFETTDVLLDANYSYSKPALREDERDGYQPLDPKGKGFSISANLFAQLSERWTLNINLTDLYSRIRWKNTGITTGRIQGTGAALQALNSVDRFLEEDIIKRFSGVDFSPSNPQDPSNPAGALPQIRSEISQAYLDYSIRRGSYTQRLPVRVNIHHQFKLNNWSHLTLGYHRFDITDFVTLGVRLWDSTLLQYEPKSKAFELGLHSRYAHLILKVDKFDIEEAKRLTLSTGVSLPW